VSTLGEAFAAFRNVMLLQERMDVMGRKLDRMSDDLKGLTDYAQAIDRRVVRIETMIEVSRQGSRAPRIEE
jgi:archaellum component FlaC